MWFLMVNLDKSHQTVPIPMKHIGRKNIANESINQISFPPFIVR